MTSRKQLLANPLLWAHGQGLKPDVRGYVASYAANLFQPLSQAALACFRSGSGNELVGVGGRPAKMSTLHSSSALVVNFFDYWIEQPDIALAALDLPTGGLSMKFESQFPTGLDGTPPNLDVAIRWADGTWLGIESKFTEWLTPKSANKEAFAAKYFPSGGLLWGGSGHSRCEQVSALVKEGQLAYRYLDAPQLLKPPLVLHALAASSSFCTCISMCRDSRAASTGQRSRISPSVSPEISNFTCAATRTYLRAWKC